MSKVVGNVTVIDHPLIQHKLTIMRNKETSIAGFRRLLREIAHLMCYEVTRDLELEMIPIETPMAAMDSPAIKGKKLVFASILRAGNGLLDGMLDLVPAARVAHIGIYRDHETLEPVEYYFKAPSNLEDRLIIVVDPMLATANSATAAIDKLKERGANNIRFLCLLPRPRASSVSARPIPTCRSSPPRSTAISTRRAISSRPRRRRRSHVRHEIGFSARADGLVRFLRGMNRPLLPSPLRERVGDGSRIPANSSYQPLIRSCRTTFSPQGRRGRPRHPTHAVGSDLLPTHLLSPGA